MKTAKLFFVYTVLALMSACDASFEGYDTDADDNGEISQAQAIFSDNYSKAIDAGTIEDVRFDFDDWESTFHAGYRLISGDFTPQWNNAQATNGIVSVGILSNVSYFAFPYSDDELSPSKSVHISQNLIIDTEQSSCLIVSEIPDYNSGKSFSGVVLYQTLSNELLKVERHSDGKLVRSINRDNEGDLSMFGKEVSDIIGKIAIGRMRNQLTRFDTENAGYSGGGPFYQMTNSEIKSHLGQLGNGGTINFSSIAQNVVGVENHYFSLVVNGVTINVSGFSFAFSGNSYQMNSTPYREVWSPDGNHVQLHYDGPSSVGNSCGMMNLKRSEYNKLPDYMKMQH